MYVKREQQREKEKSIICWSIPQMAVVARAELIQAWKPGASSPSPTWSLARILAIPFLIQPSLLLNYYLRMYHLTILSWGFIIFYMDWKTEIEPEIIEYYRRKKHWTINIQLFIPEIRTGQLLSAYCSSNWEWSSEAKN